jgi:hypothetical protein
VCAFVKSNRPLNNFVGTDANHSRHHTYCRQWRRLVGVSYSTFNSDEFVLFQDTMEIFSKQQDPLLASCHTEGFGLTLNNMADHIMVGWITKNPEGGEIQKSWNLQLICPKDVMWFTRESLCRFCYAKVDRY